MREFLVLTVALMATACSTAGVPPAPRRDPPSVVLPQPTPRPVVVPAVPPAPTPVPRPERPKVEPFDLTRLGGASETTVVSLIGPPDAVREQSPGKVWLYDHGTCRVEVYLYPSVDVGNMAVLGTAVTPDTLAAGDRERCRRSLAGRMARVR